MNVSKIAAILAIALCLFGCGAPPVKTIPAELVGVWNTDAPKYAGRYFELKKDTVVFGMGEGKATTNTVLEVKATPQDTKMLYDISYLAKEGTPQKFSFYYEQPTTTIQIKSQEKMNWKKAVDATAVLKAAAIVPAVKAPVDAQKLPPEPAKLPKKPTKDDMDDLSVTVPQNASSDPGRDPFTSPYKKPAAPSSTPIVRPPGKRGIVINQAILDGIVKTTTGMIAVISGPDHRTYFLHPNDVVFDGRVSRVTADSIVFEEAGTDPMGQQVKREVIKRIHGEK